MAREDGGKSDRVRKQLEALAYSPELLLRDIDPGRNAAILTHMSEDGYRRSSFLDGRVKRVGNRDIVVPVDALIRILKDSGKPPRTINYIFHIGHCGSTLIARLLGELDHFHALREPAVLMGLSRSYSALDNPDFDMTRKRWSELRDLVLALMARTWRPCQTAIVKPTSHAGNLIPQLMGYTGREKALFLYLDLETYLVTMMRSHTRRENRAYAKEFRVREFAGLAPSRSVDVDDYPDAHIAALMWLLHVREFALATEQSGIRARSLFINFDAFLADPTNQLKRVCGFMGVAVEDNRLGNLLSGPTAYRHAKLQEESFDAKQRALELADVRVKYSAEIVDGVEWASQVCAEEPAFANLIERYQCPTVSTAPS